MQQSTRTQIRQIKAALMGGQPQQALGEMDQLLSLLQRDPPAPEDIRGLEAAMTELRELAEAALTGAQAASDDLQAILREARSLETYDQRGRRKTSDTATAQPRRF